MKHRTDSSVHASKHVTSLQNTFAPAGSDLIRVGSRRWFLQTGLAGMGGLTLPGLLHAADAGVAEKPKK